jgi:hypothetical protein
VLATIAAMPQPDRALGERAPCDRPSQRASPFAETLERDARVCHGRQANRGGNREVPNDLGLKETTQCGIPPFLSRSRAMRRLFGTLALIALGTGSATAGPADSGLRPGEEVSAWEPIHVAGPHAGTKTCPVCTYLDSPVLLAFAKDVAAATDLVVPLENIATAHAKVKLKVLLVVVNCTDEEIRKFATDHSIQNLMLCRPDPRRQEKQLKAYKIDASVTNTILLYQNYTVRQNWAAMAAPRLSELKTATEAYLPKP